MSIMTACAAWVLSAALAQEAPAPEEPATGEEGEEASAATETLKRIVDTMRAEPPLSAGERLEQAAAAASGVVRPLPVPVAIPATLLGFMLLLFGQRLFRIGTVAYLAALFGFAGREIGAQLGEGWGPYVGGGLGCLIGAAVALPLRALARGVIGGLAGGVLLVVVMQSITSSWLVTLGAAAGGILVSGILTLYFPRPLLIVGFAMFGAATASVGVLSVGTEPVDGTLVYRTGHVLGVLLAAGLGVLFQWQLGLKEEPDEPE
jgi:hypothetical protein